MIIKIADPKSNQFIMALVVVTQICVRMYSTAKSCLTPCNPIGCSHQAPLSMGLSRQKYWSGCHFLRQGIFPTQGLNPRLLHVLHWQVGFFTTEPPRKLLHRYVHFSKLMKLYT